MSSGTARREPDHGSERRPGDPPQRETVSAEVARAEWLLLASSGWYVRLDEVLDRPTTAVLATEDACLYFAWTDWQRRRPHRWQRRAHAEWVTEGERLAEKRDRLVQLTRQVRTLRPHVEPRTAGLKKRR